MGARGSRGGRECAGAEDSVEEPRVRSTDEEAERRVAAALAAAHPDAADPVAPKLLRAFAFRHMLRAVSCLQTSSKGSDLKRMVVVTRLNVYLCTRAGEARRVLPLHRIRSATVRTSGTQRSEVLLKVAPPDADILFRVQELSQPPLRLGGARAAAAVIPQKPHTHVRALLSCLSAAKQLVIGDDLPVTWTEDASADLRSQARLEKPKAARRPPPKHLAAALKEPLSLADCAEISETRFAEPLPPPTPPKSPSSAGRAPRSPSMSGGDAEEALASTRRSASPKSPSSAPRSPQAAEAQLLTPEQTTARVKAVLHAEYPEVSTTMSTLAKFSKSFPDKFAVCAIVVDKVSDQGKVQKRVLAVSRFNFYLCGLNGTVRRIIQYRHFVAATAIALGSKRCEVLLQAAPPEHDLLVRISCADQPFPLSDGSTTDHAHAHGMLAAISRAREHVAGAPLPCRWLQQDEVPNLKAYGQLRKCAGWRSPEAIFDGLVGRGALDALIDMSGIRYAPPREEEYSDCDDNPSDEQSSREIARLTMQPVTEASHCALHSLIDPVVLPVPASPTDDGAQVGGDLRMAAVRKLIAGDAAGARVCLAELAGEAVDGPPDSDCLLLSPTGMGGLYTTATRYAAAPVRPRRRWSLLAAGPGSPASPPCALPRAPLRPLVTSEKLVSL
eukprot:TRINITY_DN13129_c1_g1_i1.p1 TRINITY_DN13129_c1_g1~~TRINITY_DN13129_c1_g1_i1.p1  ORF type:complete len:670 (+),score=183.31 TRINITY_DN13129_c1_g1_i1:58-2067(+)